MDLAKLSTREKFLISLALFSLIMWIFYQFFWRPQIHKIQENYDSLQSVKNILSKNGTNSESQKQLEEKSKSKLFDPLYYKIENKNKNYTAILLDFISEQKTTNDLEVVSFNPLKQDLYKNYKHYPYNVKVRISYQNFYNFLNLFNNLPILALIDQQNIQKDETLPNYLNIEMIIGVYESN